jgi:hypothetical protein
MEVTTLEKCFSCLLFLFLFPYHKNIVLVCYFFYCACSRQVIGDRFEREL